MLMGDLVEMVRAVNPNRTPGNLKRRLLKILEELGETSEAYLSVSSPHNYKSKSWADYREESVDTLIVLIDVALTEVTDFPASTLIPAHINIATGHRFDSVAALIDEKFTVAGAVASAARYLNEKNYMGFYGAVGRGIQAASNMCFAMIPDDEDKSVINDRVHAMFELKIAKWNAGLRQYAATDDGI